MSSALTKLVLEYYHEFPDLKNENQSLNNLAFNQTHGLYIAYPAAWGYTETLLALLEETIDTRKTLIVYDNTNTYENISKELQEYRSGVSFLSWHEIFVALSRNNIDVRHIKDIRERIMNSHLVVFVGAAKSLPDIMDWLRQACDCCLIILG